MRLKIEFDISLEELPQAKEILETLRSLNTEVKAQNPERLFRSLLLQLDEASSFDSVVNNVSLLLQNNTEEVEEQFVKEFSSIIIELESKPYSHMPVTMMRLLSLLPDSVKEGVRGALLSRMLDHLKLTREVWDDRSNVLLQADIIVCFLMMDLISASKLLETIIMPFLSKLNTCVSAVTLICRALEICPEKFLVGVDEMSIGLLHRSLEVLMDKEEFREEVGFIMESLWERFPGSNGVAQSEPQEMDIIGPSNYAYERVHHEIEEEEEEKYLEERGKDFWMEEEDEEISGGMTWRKPDNKRTEAESSLWRKPNAPYIFARNYMADIIPTNYSYKTEKFVKGPRSSILSLAFDESRGNLISADRGGSLFAWDSNDKRVGKSKRLEMRGHHPCDIDFTCADGGVLIVGAVAKDSLRQSNFSSYPVLLSYGWDYESSTWQERNRIIRESSKTLSCLKVLGDGDSSSFITGETIFAVRQRYPFYDEQVVLYDQTLKPISQHGPHMGIVTALASNPLDEHIFMSGSKDSIIRIWDCRLSGSVGVLGKTNHNGAISSHHGAVTSIDANSEGLVISGGADGFVKQWEMRTLSQTGTGAISDCSVDSTPVVKVAIGGPNQENGAAVATVKNIHFLRFADSTPTVETWGRGEYSGTYRDIIWSSDKRRLFAAGDDMRIDIYEYPFDVEEAEE